MKTKEHSHLLDNVVSALRKAATELEAFQVQVALGKAEAEDTFEKAKKKFDGFIHESKFKVKEGQQQLNDLHGMFDEVQVQLALGKADTLDAFKDQKKKLLNKLHEIEVEIKTNKLHTSVVIKSSNNKRDSLNNKLGCDETEINRWLEKNLFFVMKSHSSSRIQFFYDDIIDRFKLFYDYMKEIKEKCSKEPQLKHLSLSKSNRSMEKRKQMIDKNNMKQTRSTFHKTNVN